MPKITNKPKDSGKDEERDSPRGSVESPALPAAWFQISVFMVSAKIAKESNINAMSQIL